MLPSSQEQDNSKEMTTQVLGNSLMSKLASVPAHLLNASIRYPFMFKKTVIPSEFVELHRGSTKTRYDST